MNDFVHFFIKPYYDKAFIEIFLEAVAFFFGIASVYYAKKENIWVYPTGLISTVITVYLLYKARYLGDMMMNIYYSAMSIYGWWVWTRKKDNRPVVKISRTNARQKWMGIGLFVLTLIVTYLVYRDFNYEMKWANYVDVVTSGMFFTAMWYMAIKKIENWTLWIIADAITVPLYAFRGLGMLSFQYLIFLILAIQAYVAWRKVLVGTDGNG